MRKIPLLYVLLYKNLLKKCDPKHPGLISSHDVGRVLSRTAFGLDAERKVRIMDELQGMGLVREIRRDQTMLEINIGSVPDV